MIVNFCYFVGVGVGGCGGMCICGCGYICLSLDFSGVNLFPVFFWCGQLTSWDWSFPSSTFFRAGFLC